MNKKVIVTIFIVLVLVAIGTLLSEKDTDDAMKQNDSMIQIEHTGEDSMVKEGSESMMEKEADTKMMEEGDSMMMEDVELKEFSMDSFFVMEDGKPHPQFSMDEITVKKGDKVKINITNTKGDHDFNIDEFGVFTETPLDETVSVEFTADKAGEFVYYCAKPGHRANGHWGTLKVVE